MATDNKNKNSVDDNSEDDTTSELAIIKIDLPPVDSEAEADASTFAFDDDDLDGKSVASLRSELKSRDRSIEQLQFEAEQLRARWSGLEKEISAREELTAILQQDLRDAHKEKTATNRLLKKNAHEIESLQSRLDQLESEPEISASGEVEDIALVGNEATLDPAALLQAEEEIARLNSRLKKERSKSKQARKKYRALTLDITACEDNGEYDFQQRLAEQSGKLVSNRDEIADLKGQIFRSERYADGLRNTLKDLDIVSSENIARRRQLDTSLERATEQIRELREQLEAERLLSTGLEAANSDLKETFEKEVNIIRFELGAAQQTIGDFETVNEELSSNLFDNAQFRQALENQLSSTEEQRDVEVSQLQGRTRKQQSLLEDYERKIIAKDSTISALIGELSSKSKVIDSLDEVSSVISEIDDKIPGRNDESSEPERDRPTRLLIGVIDGQELRFPLFKERLTIGRTRQNDIQLKAQYVSRRHAVIVSEDDGPRIIDWGSRNGIAVNGKRVSEKRLESGDTVKIGTAEFVFEERQKR